VRTGTGAAVSFHWTEFEERERADGPRRMLAHEARGEASEGSDEEEHLRAQHLSGSTPRV